MAGHLTLVRPLTPTRQRTWPRHAPLGHTTTAALIDRRHLGSRVQFIDECGRQQDGIAAAITCLPGVLGVQLDTGDVARITDLGTTVTVYPEVSR